MEISAEQRTRIEELCRQGLFLQALEAARPLGPLPGWQGAEAMLLAARIAVRLGGAALSHWLAGRAWRLAPDNPLARCRYAYALTLTRGPYAAWRWMKDADEPEEEEPQAEWRGLRAQLAASLRDFDAAETWLARAASRRPRRRGCTYAGRSSSRRRIVTRKRSRRRAWRWRWIRGFPRRPRRARTC